MRRQLSNPTTKSNQSGNMTEAEIMSEEFGKVREMVVEEIRRQGNDNLADIIETKSAQKLADETYIEGLRDLFPEYKSDINEIHNQVLELQEQGSEAYDWTLYFENPHNQSKKGFMQAKLAKDIERDYTFRKLRDSEEIYVFKDGYFQPKGEQIIEEECAKRLDPHFEPKYVAKVKAFIEARNYISRKDFRPPKRKINLENGVYDLETEELLEHKPDYNFRHKVPVKYNPAADCPNIHDFLDSIVETEEEVKTLREIAGYLLLPDYPIAKSFMLIGKGSNGKSLYLDLLKNLIGEGNYVNKSLQDLEENQYATYKLVGSLACFDDDLPSDKLTRTSTVKKLTGGSDIGAEKKYGDQFDFKNIAKLVFACNELPQTTDQSDGFYRRWMLVEFPYKFKEKPDPIEDKEKKAKPRKKVMEEITNKEELEGFLWWAIEALKDVINNNEFTYAPETEEARDKWREYSTPLIRFIDEYIEQGTMWDEAEKMANDNERMANFYYDYIRKDYLKQVIGDYCEARSHSRPTKKEITKALKESDFYFNPKARTRRESDMDQVRVYGGLTMKHPDPERCDGVTGYSQTLYHARVREEDTKQSVHTVTPPSPSDVYEVINNSGSDGITVGEVAEELEVDDELVEKHVQSLYSDGDIIEASAKGRYIC